MFTASLELQFHIFNAMGKIIQNVKFLPASQDNDLNLKLNPTHQQESRGMLCFQNIAPNIKILKFHTNRDNITYLKKCKFSTEARLPILRLPFDSWHQNESKSGLRS